jgi:hypothetical protein
MIPGISSGDLQQQSRFLSNIKIKTKIDTVVFQHWGHADFTRKMASPLATATAAGDLVALCEKIRSGGNNKTIDIIAHSAGTIVINKAANQFRAGKSPVRFGQVLLLGTPHDPEVDMSALKNMSDTILNIHSAYDKINRNVSGNLGIINALTKYPYTNLQRDTTLGERRVRHYVFLENTPENWLQYSTFLNTGKVLLPGHLQFSKQYDVEALCKIALNCKSGQLSSQQKVKLISVAEKSLANIKPEIKYYGAALAGLLKANQLRPMLKTALETDNPPPYLRREIYQALGNITDPADLRYLQQARKKDPQSGDALRDVLREWKRKRIRPGR